MNSFEDIVKTNDTTIDKIVTDIIKHCDTENTGYITVTNLINYIKPFVEEDMVALIDLKNTLDPEQKNPTLTSDVVMKVMNEWLSKLRETVQDENNASVSLVNEARTNPLAFSTPVKTAELLNESLFNNHDSYRYLHADKSANTYFEERINNIVFQCQKARDDLETARITQYAMEEANEKLQTQVNELDKENVQLKNTIKAMEKDKQDYDELNEILNAEKLNTMQLSRRLEKAEKEIENMRKNKEQLEKEKFTLENKCEKINKERREYFNMITELETEVSIKEAEAEKLQNKIMVLQEEINDQKEYATYLVESNEQLKTQKLTYSKHLLKTIRKSDSFSVSRRASLSSSSTSSGINRSLVNEFKPPFRSERFTFYNIESPYARTQHGRHSLSTPTQNEILRECKKFNSPALLDILSQPLSPLYSPNKLEKKVSDTLIKIQSPRKLYDAGKDLLPITSVATDVQLSYNEDDLQMLIDCVNLDRSAYESLHSELLQADQGGHTEVFEEYETRIKLLTDEIITLKDELKLHKENEKLMEISSNEFLKENNKIFITEMKFDLSGGELSTNDDKYESALKLIEDLQLELDMKTYQMFQLNEENACLKTELLQLQNNEKSISETESVANDSTCNLDKLFENNNDEFDDADLKALKRTTRKVSTINKKSTAFKRERQNTRLAEKLEEIEEKLIKEEGKTADYVNKISLLKREIEDLTLKLHDITLEKDEQIVELEQRINFLMIEERELSKKLSDKNNQIKELQHKMKPSMVFKLFKIFVYFILLILFLNLTYTFVKIHLSCPCKRIGLTTLNEIWNSVYKEKRLHTPH